MAYEGSLRVTSDTFTDTLLDEDSPDYKEKEDKYGGMVSCLSMEFTGKSEDKSQMIQGMRARVNCIQLSLLRTSLETFATQPFI